MFPARPLILWAINIVRTWNDRCRQPRGGLPYISLAPSIHLAIHPSVRLSVRPFVTLAVPPLDSFDGRVVGGSKVGALRLAPTLYILYFFVPTVLILVSPRGTSDESKSRVFTAYLVYVK